MSVERQTDPRAARRAGRGDLPRLGWLVAAVAVLIPLGARASCAGDPIGYRGVSLGVSAETLTGILGENGGHFKCSGRGCHLFDRVSSVPVSLEFVLGPDREPSGPRVVEQIRCGFPTRDYAAIRAELSGRYGKPTTDTTRRQTACTGETVEKGVSTWVLPGGTITAYSYFRTAPLEERGRDVRQGIVLMTTEKGLRR